MAMEIISRVAVVIIDMQSSLIENVHPERLQVMLFAQESLLSVCKKNRIPVFVMETIGKGATIPETENALKGCLVKKMVRKNENIFYEGFDKILKRRGIRNLIMSGLYEGGCVYLASDEAKNRGYKVITSLDLMTNSEGAKSSYEGSIDQHNEELSGLGYWYEWNTKLLYSVNQLRTFRLCPARNLHYFLDFLKLKY